MFFSLYIYIMSFLLYLLIYQTPDTEIQKGLGTPEPKLVCLQRVSLRNVPCGCPTTVGSSTHCEDALWLSAPSCFSADSLLFWSTNKSVPRGGWQPSFARDLKERRKYGGVQFLEALQIIKVSCFNPRHVLLPYGEHGDTVSTWYSARKIHP